MVANAALQATDPDLWHVLMAPGETKILSLEQLDDLFRLEIIDADTRVWQAGMPEWLPLSVVAGMDDDEPTVAAAAPTLPRNVPPPHRGPAPPLPPKRAQSAARQAVTQPPTRQTMRAIAAVPQAQPYAATVPAYAQSAYPQQGYPQQGYPQQQAQAYAQTQPAQDPYANRGNITGQYPVQQYPAPVAQASAWPPVVSGNSAWPAAVESVRPMAISHRPAPPQPSGGGWGGRFVLTMAFAAGLALTLYRNDVLRTAAASVGSSGRYLELERSLGGPSFGTPRAVQAMAEFEPARSLPTLPSLNTSATSSSTTTTSTAVGSVSTATTPAAEPATPAPSEPTRSTPAPEKAGPSLASQMATQLAREPAAKPAPRHTSAAAPARPSAPARKAAAASSDDLPKSPIKGSSNAYDPLNGKL